MLAGKLTRSTAHAALWVLAWLLAMALAMLIPPMQSPDEMSHIDRAYLISRGHLLLQAPPADLTVPADDKDTMALIERARQQGGRMGGMVDQGLLDFSDAYLRLARQADHRLSPREREQLAQMPWTGASRYFLLAGTGYYFPAIYAPQALGLAIGQQLNWSIEHTYRLARASTLLVCFALLGLAFRQLRPNPAVIAVLLLPMSLFQLLSPTIDGLTNALAVLASSLFLSAADRTRPHSAAASWSLALCIFLLATSRTHLLPLLALPFFLAWQRQSRRDVYLGGLVTVATLGWVLFALDSTSDPRVVRSHTTTELLMHYASHPAAFIQILVASLTDSALFNFYQQSFIGILGWLDTRLPSYFYPALWTGLAVSGLASVSLASLRTDWRPRLLLIGVALASGGLVFLALLVTWTPHPATVVRGVQGRYFVVPMLLLGYAASGLTATRPPRQHRISNGVIAVFALMSLGALTMTLLSRYH